MDQEKQVDESWKEAAKHDQQGQECGCGEEHHDHSGHQAVEINFINYITSLGFQALIFMGEIPNPMTNEKEKNIIQAKFIIDTLTMLKEKTKNNLNEQEANLLESSIYELQMKYVETVKAEESEASSPDGKIIE